MTTTELIDKLKALGVDDEQADSFRDFHLKSTPGGYFRIPIPLDGGKLIYIGAYFTDEEKGFVPEWDSITR